MPDTPKKISEQASITSIDANADLLAIVDVSEPALIDRNKKATVKQLLDQATFTQFGTGAVTRTVISKLRDVVNVKDFGATGNGIVDDTAAIQAASDATPRGGTLLFDCNRRYLASASIIFRSPHVIDMQGSTLVSTNAFSTGSLVSYQDWEAEYSAPTHFASFSLPARSSVFTIPAGVNIQVGNVVKFGSANIYVSGGGITYFHGFISRVLSIIGSTATLSCPSYDIAFDVNNITVYNGFDQMTLRNGTIDISAVPSNTSSFAEALIVRGSNAYIHNCTFIGSEYAGIGCRVDCDKAVIEQCTSIGFRNTQGYGGLNRVGYGFALSGSNPVARNCTAINCKHGFSVPGNNSLVLNPRFIKCTVHEDPSNPQNHYQGSFDLHSNAYGDCLIENCTAYTSRKALNIRASSAKILGGKFYQYNSGELIEGYEEEFKNLEIRGVEYKLADINSSFLRFTSNTPAGVDGAIDLTISDCRSVSAVGDFIDITRATALSKVVIQNCRHNGGWFFYSIANGCSFNELRISGNDVSCSYGAIRISGTGASTAISDLIVTDNYFRKTTSDSSDFVEIIESSQSTTRLPITRLVYESNTHIHANDTGSGYSLSFSALSVITLSIKNNTISRSSFRNFNINGCQFINGIVSGNNFDGDVFINNTPAATVLTRFAFVGNVGSRYQVNTNELGITKTTYFESGNAFTTYIP